MMEERDDFSYLNSAEDEYYKKFGISAEKIDEGVSLGLAFLTINTLKSGTYTSICSNGVSVLGG